MLNKWLFICALFHICHHLDIILFLQQVTDPEVLAAASKCPYIQQVVVSQTCHTRQFFRDNHKWQPSSLAVALFSFAGRVLRIVLLSSSALHMLFLLWPCSALSVGCRQRLATHRWCPTLLGPS